MRPLKNAALFFTAITVSLIVGCVLAEPQKSVENREDVEQIIHDYVMQDPDVLRQALIVLQERSRNDERQAERTALQTYSNQIFRDPRDFSIGPKGAKVQIVEFFDYNCGYCKRSLSYMLGLPETYGDDVRVVFKEYPVLSGPTGLSATAARAALAAKEQGKYLEMHERLMLQRGLRAPKIYEIAAEIGLDIERLKIVMDRPEIADHIRDNRALEDFVPGLGGTPTFIVNDQYVHSADTRAVTRLIKAELSSTG